MKFIGIKVTEELLQQKELTEDTYIDQTGKQRYIAYHKDHVVVETETGISVVNIGGYIFIPDVPVELMW